MAGNFSFLPREIVLPWIFVWYLETRELQDVEKCWNS